MRIIFYLRILAKNIPALWRLTDGPYITTRHFGTDHQELYKWYLKKMKDLDMAIANKVKALKEKEAKS